MPKSPVMPPPTFLVVCSCGHDFPLDWSSEWTWAELDLAAGRDREFAEIECSACEADLRVERLPSGALEVVDA